MLLCPCWNLLVIVLALKPTFRCYPSPFASSVFRAVFILRHPCGKVTGRVPGCTETPLARTVSFSFERQWC